MVFIMHIAQEETTPIKPYLHIARAHQVVEDHPVVAVEAEEVANSQQGFIHTLDKAFFVS
jgi:hypothetical protein